MGLCRDGQPPDGGVPRHVPRQGAPRSLPPGLRPCRPRLLARMGADAEPTSRGRWARARTRARPRRRPAPHVDTTYRTCSKRLHRRSSGTGRSSETRLVGIFRQPGSRRCLPRRAAGARASPSTSATCSQRTLRGRCWRSRSRPSASKGRPDRIGEIVHRLAPLLAGPEAGVLAAQHLLTLASFESLLADLPGDQRESSRKRWGRIRRPPL